MDGTPTHSYLKALYKYPQAAFPYGQLVAENQQRDKFTPEFELIDTGIFAENRYFDVTIEYAKAAPEDILIQISITNRGPAPAPLHLLPTLWFRNTWSWGDGDEKPGLHRSHLGQKGLEGIAAIASTHAELGQHWLYCEGAEPDGTAPPVYFTENETNYKALFDVENSTPYVKDGIHRRVIRGEVEAVNPQRGTKAAVHYVLDLAAGETRRVRLRLSNHPSIVHPFGAAFDSVLADRIQEADEFYHKVNPCGARVTLLLGRCEPQQNLHDDDFDDGAAGKDDSVAQFWLVGGHRLSSVGQNRWVARHACHNAQHLVKRHPK